ncbi:MAG TPA: hypothetical protein PKC96_05800 [Bacilli bacterium]|jgi:hypothetical protein|nr:hypothetical protein [Bacilli bacterium]
MTKTRIVFNGWNRSKSPAVKSKIQIVGLIQKETEKMIVILGHTEDEKIDCVFNIKKSNITEREDKIK